MQENSTRMKLTSGEPHVMTDNPAYQKDGESENLLVNGSRDTQSGIDTRKKLERKKGNSTVIAGRW